MPSAHLPCLEPRLFSFQQPVHPYYSTQKEWETSHWHSILRCLRSDATLPVSVVCCYECRLYNCQRRRWQRPRVHHGRLSLIAIQTVFHRVLFGKPKVINLTYTAKYTAHFFDLYKINSPHKPFARM